MTEDYDQMLGKNKIEVHGANKIQAGQGVQLDKGQPSMSMKAKSEKEIDVSDPESSG